jgi:predicted dehydrogenase
MIRIGMIGAGPNATGHAKYYHQSPRTDVVAVADVDTQRAQTLADLVQARPTDDYTRMLSDVDAVVISSPNFLHAAQAVTCAQAGLAVYCEKPMGVDLQEARRIADAVAENNVASAVGFSVRFGPVVQTMQRYLRQGRLGQAISLWSRRITYADPTPAGQLAYRPGQEPRAHLRKQHPRTRMALCPRRRTGKRPRHHAQRDGRGAPGQRPPLGDHEL